MARVCQLAVSAGMDQVSRCNHGPLGYSVTITGDFACVCRQILGRATLSTMAVGLTGVASFLRVFAEERVQYWREASGLPQPWYASPPMLKNAVRVTKMPYHPARHTVAYFLAKDISMLPQVLLAPLVYCIVFISITSPR